MNSVTKSGDNGNKDLFSHSTVRNEGIQAGSRNHCEKARKATAQRQREYANARKARKKAQRARAAEMPGKPKRARINRKSPKKIGGVSAELYERMIEKVCRPECIPSHLALHRYLVRRGAGGYDIRQDGFSINGKRLKKEEIRVVKRLLATALDAAKPVFSEEGK